MTPRSLRNSCRTARIWRCLTHLVCGLVFVSPSAHIRADEVQLPTPVESVRAWNPLDVNVNSREQLAFEELVANDASAAEIAHADVSPREFLRTGDFPHSVLIPGTNVSAKVGGFAKFDFIQDFNSIGSTDLFDTTTIPTSGPQKGNTRLHARQTRLNLDLRHPSEWGDVQVFAEGDFFGTENAFRLRHAYGKMGPLLAGQTWSTFMDENVMPQLVDFESPTGALLTRRALLRWTQPLDVIEGLEYALAVEDPTPTFTSPAGTFENALPDFIGRLRYQQHSVHAQLAGFLTQAHFDPTVGANSEATAWGVSLSSSLQLTESDKFMGQIAYGDGIERFRGFPGYRLDANGSLIAAPLLAWYVGYEHAWSDQWKSVLAYSRPTVDLQAAPPTALKVTDYFAVNLLWTPIERVRLGVEYLHGVREDENTNRGEANRVQFAVWYYLP